MMLLVGWVAVFVVGVIIGGGAVGVFWWAYATVVEEEARDPLAELMIADESLSREQVDAFIQQLGKRYHDEASACLVVAAVVAEDSRYFTFGKLPNGSEPDKQTIFELASVGKTMTGLLFAEMIQRGEVTAEMSVESLLPPETAGVRFEGKTISLLDLATQSSGLVSVPGNMPAKNPLNPYADYTVPLLYEELRSTKLEFPPGRGYHYSNLGFGLLGHVLALKADQDYESLIVQRICEPLGMSDTRMKLTDDQRSRVATPHDGGQPVEVWEDVTMAGAGSFLSSAEDMARYLRSYWSHREGPLGPVLSLAVKKHRRTNTPSTSIGFGWHIDSENAFDIVWHNGGSGGSRSYVAMLPERQIGVCVLANWSQANVDELGRKLMYLLSLQQRMVPQPVE